jgi:sodium-dependent phosphate cotransporter
VLLFFPIPVLRKLPLELANGLGKLTLRYRLAGFVYILTTFFFVPFTLIYFNQDSIRTLDLTYQQTDSAGNASRYRMVARMNTRTQTGEWTKYEEAEAKVGEQPSLIFPISVKNNSLFVGKKMFMFSRPGFCWDGEDDNGKFKSCIEEVLPSLTLSQTTFDSVYVCDISYSGSDSTIHRYYVSAPYKIMLQHEVLTPGRNPQTLEKLVRFEAR